MILQMQSERPDVFCLFVRVMSYLSSRALVDVYNSPSIPP